MQKCISKVRGSGVLSPKSILKLLGFWAAKIYIYSYSYSVHISIRDHAEPIMLIFYLLCYAVVFINNYAYE